MRYQNPCAACKYHKKGCYPKCILAPILAPNRVEDYEAVCRVFTARNFMKLIKLVKPDQQALAAESLITEAKARITDRVRGLAGTVHNLYHRLDGLQSELDLIKQQNELIRRRHTLQHKHLVSIPSTLHQQLGSYGDFLIPVPSDKKSCAACAYRKKKCRPKCPFAPFFPSNRAENFQDVSNVFGASNFIKLIKLAGPKQHLAAETIIIEAIARVFNPVHGLAGIAETLSQQLDDLTSELTTVNQQNKHYLDRIIVVQEKLVEEPQNRLIFAEGASSQARVVLPPLTLQDIDSYYNWISSIPWHKKNDGFSLNFPSVQVPVTHTTASSSDYPNPMTNMKAKLKSAMDAKESTVNPNLCSSGAIFECSNNFHDVKPPGTAGSSSSYTNQLTYIRALQYDMDAKESTMNLNLCSSGDILECSNNSDGVNPTSIAALSSFYPNQRGYIQTALKADMVAKQSKVNPNLCSRGSIIKSSDNVADVKPTVASLSLYTNKLRDNQAELNDHMDAKELSLTLTLSSSGTISTKGSIQDNKDITWKGTRPTKEEPRFI